MILTVIFIERKSPTEALLWVFVMICLPYAGTILYLVFGSTAAIKLTAFFRKRRLLNNPSGFMLAEASDIKENMLSEEDVQVIRFNSTYNGSRLTCCDKAEFLTDGESHYKRLFQDIEKAEQSIYIEFYTIHHDVVGEKLVELLAKKAKEGVDVWVMCDFIANLSTPQKMFRPLTEANGKVIRVKPYFTHYRSHRKIVSIDFLYWRDEYWKTVRKYG